VVVKALELPDLSPRELSVRILDEDHWYVSESSVYRILKARGLITSPNYIVMKASSQFKDKPAKVHSLWQMDFTYFKIVGWGWYYQQSILDDFSYYIIAWELCTNMCSDDVENLVQKALEITGLEKDQRPKLLSDNGSCYIAKDQKDFVREEKIIHIHGKPYHPQTQGKIERYNRSMKHIFKLENYYFPEELERQIAQFIDYYNNQRFHESLQNLTPADVFFGRDQEILAQRELIKHNSIPQRRDLYLERKLALL